MRRIWVAAPTLATVLMLGLLGPALAAPVFYTKVEYGATASTPIKFGGTFGAALLEGQTSKGKIECAHGTASGEVTGPTTARNAEVLLRECQTGGIPCKNTGSNEIKLNPLEGELGDVQVGVPGLRLFDQAGGRGAIFAEFECGGLPVKSKGSVIGQLSGGAGNTVSEGKFAGSLKLTFSQSAGVQKYTRFVGETGSEQLESKGGAGEYEKGGESVVATLRAEGLSNLGFTK
jgi:hypothetical protein